MLDFTYMGGIYRDCWLVSHGDIYVTDPNYEDIPAGGGLLVTYEDVSDRSARVKLLTHIRNERPGGFSGRLNYELIDPDGRTVATHSRALEALRRKRPCHYRYSDRGRAPTVDAR